MNSMEAQTSAATARPARGTAEPPRHQDDQQLVSRLLLFFGLVYVVEGLGQVVGLISQPLAYYLKEVHGWTPLHLAARNGHADCVRPLVAAGADLKYTVGVGFAVKEREREISQMLMP